MTNLKDGGPVYKLSDPDKPLYYTIKQDVYRQSVSSDGGLSWSLEYPICTVHEIIDADNIAEILSSGDDVSAMLTERERRDGGAE